MTAQNTFRYVPSMFWLHLMNYHSLWIFFLSNSFSPGLNQFMLLPASCCSIPKPTTSQKSLPIVAGLQAGDEICLLPIFTLFLWHQVIFQVKMIHSPHTTSDIPIPAPRYNVSPPPILTPAIINNQQGLQEGSQQATWVEPLLTLTLHQQQRPTDAMSRRW